MWVYNLNPTILSLGPLQIRWYGLVYVLCFFLTVWWMQYLVSKKKLELGKEETWDLCFYLLLGGVLGGRLFMIFWNPSDYLLQPWNLLKIWEGGMSFHGGLVGVVLMAYWYCRQKKLSFLVIADAASVPIMLALALGRLANFVNGELIGRVWNGPGCVVFPEYGGECRYPNMIYSFFQRMLVFGGLLGLSFWKEFKPGFVFWNLVLWEGVGRIIMDYFREDVLYYGWSLGQWFSLVMVIVAGVVLLRKYRRDVRGVLFLGVK